MGRRQKNYVPPPPPITIRCTRCGQNKAEIEFYVNRWSNVYKRVPLCKDCVQAIFTENTYRYGEKMALYLTCAVLDIPYLSERYKKIVETAPPFTLGKYIRQLQMNQYKSASFAESVADGDFPIVDRTGGIYFATNERVDTIQAEVTALRDELRDLKVKLAESGIS